MKFTLSYDSYIIFKVSNKYLLLITYHFLILFSRQLWVCLALIYYCDWSFPQNIKIYWKKEAIYSLKTVFFIWKILNETNQMAFNFEIQNYPQKSNIRSIVIIIIITIVISFISWRLYSVHDSNAISLNNFKSHPQ